MYGMRTIFPMVKVKAITGVQDVDPIEVGKPIPAKDVEAIVEDIHANIEKDTSFVNEVKQKNQVLRLKSALGISGGKPRRYKKSFRRRPFKRSFKRYRPRPYRVLRRYRRRY